MLHLTLDWMTVAPIAEFSGIALALLNARFKNERAAFLFSSIEIADIILTTGLSMLPFTCRLVQTW